MCTFYMFMPIQNLLYEQILTKSSLIKHSAESSHVHMEAKGQQTNTFVDR